MSAVREKSLFWVGSSKKNLLEFPADVQLHPGATLRVAQFGGSIQMRSHGRAMVRV
jgi:hypothetical protein